MRYPCILSVVLLSAQSAGVAMAAEPMPTASRQALRAAVQRIATNLGTTRRPAISLSGPLSRGQGVWISNPKENGAFRVPSASGRNGALKVTGEYWHAAGSPNLGIPGDPARRQIAGMLGQELQGKQLPSHLAIRLENIGPGKGDNDVIRASLVNLLTRSAKNVKIPSKR